MKKRELKDTNKVFVVEEKGILKIIPKRS